VALKVSSSHRPGLDQSFFEGQLSGPQSLGGLPDAALKKIALVQSLEFNTVSLMTVVPKFDARTPKAVIAADYHLQLQRLLRRSGDSAFIKGALAQLDAFIGQPHPEAGSSANEIFPPLKQAPAPGAVMEEQVYQAMRLALGF
jgi:hypothetical protein